jgi:hypothetical protein
MPNLQCPSTDINLLNVNSFQFKVERLPDVSFFIQQVSFPTISLPPLETPTTQATLKLPSDKIAFGTLGITFLVDSKLKNYAQVFNWMTGLGHPESYNQYTTENNTRPQFHSESQRNYSDAVLVLQGPEFETISTFKFIDCFPISLSGIDYASTNNHSVYAKSTVEFEFTYLIID